MSAWSLEACNTCRGAGKLCCGTAGCLFTAGLMHRRKFLRLVDLQWSRVRRMLLRVHMAFQVWIQSQAIFFLRLLCDSHDLWYKLSSHIDTFSFCECCKMLGNIIGRQFPQIADPNIDPKCENSYCYRNPKKGTPKCWKPRLMKGKTTTLQMLCGLQPPSSGSVAGRL